MKHATSDAMQGALTTVRNFYGYFKICDSGLSLRLSSPPTGESRHTHQDRNR